jgi:hypothetical protein
MKITSSARSTSRCLGSQGRENLVSIWEWKILNSPNSLVREVVVIGTGVFAFVMPSSKACSLPVMMCRRPISMSSGQVFHVRNSPYLPSRSLGLGRRWLRSAMHVNICYCSLQLNTSCALSITIGQRPYELNEPVVLGMRRRTNWVQLTVTLLDTVRLRLQSELCDIPRASTLAGRSPSRQLNWHSIDRHALVLTFGLISSCLP